MDRDPKGGIEDFEQALNLNPMSHAARRNIAYLLSEKLDRVEDSIKCLDALIADYPNDAAAYGGRGVLLSRIGEFEKAIEDARKIVALDAGPRPLLQAACIYSMASRKHPELKMTAVSLLGSSFKLDADLATLAETDTDLGDIHDEAAFRELYKAAQQFAAIPSPESAVEAMLLNGEGE